MELRNLPTRVATGGYILHSGVDKWRADEATAEKVHGVAVGTYPFLERVPPHQFLRMLAGGEIAIGAMLLAPMVSTAVAGAALTGFSGALLGLYARTPGMRKPDSIWPTQQGTAISKDIWMLGIGLGLLTSRRRRRRS